MKEIVQRLTEKGEPSLAKPLSSNLHTKLALEASCALRAAFCSLHGQSVIVEHFTDPVAVYTA